MAHVFLEEYSRGSGVSIYDILRSWCRKGSGERIGLVHKLCCERLSCCLTGHVQGRMLILKTAIRGQEVVRLSSIYVLHLPRRHKTSFTFSSAGCTSLEPGPRSFKLPGSDCSKSGVDVQSDRIKHGKKQGLIK